MSNGLTPTEIFQQRQDFERGLLAVILDQGRRSGFERMGRVAQTISAVLPQNNAWGLLTRWLSALASERLALTSESLELLRQVGKTLKDLDRQARQTSAADKLMPLDVAFGAAPLRAALASADASAEVDTAQWSALQQQLQATTQVAELRACFDQVAEFAEALKWRDAMEISGAQMNLLDRLLDGTLPTAPEHFEVLGDAKTLLFGLKLPVIEAANETQIDDKQYERVIERADVLASGGEFVLDDEAPNNTEDALVQVQLATVLDMLPSLLEAYREQVEAGSVQHELDADLQAVAEAAERLRVKLT
ncbi:MAG: hypothetical protein CMP83_00175 [Gammaproteobacteria bacterium]|nr:hypothetical protein [Gammaproteobacteria bacterium]